MNTLDDLSVPAEHAPAGTWQIFTTNLLNILCIHFSIEDYEFTEEEVNHISNYLLVNELLISCLRNAYVSEREQIIDALLRLPKIE